MDEGAKVEQLLKCLIHVIGRAARPVEDVQAIVGSGRRQVKAFNLCNGSNSQNEIARKSGIDQGNLSRSCSRWVEHGVAFWIGEGKEARLLHIYAIPIATSPKPRPRRKRPSR